MNKMNLIGGLAALTGLAIVSSASAAVTIVLDNVGVLAGTTAVVGVYASSNAGDVISGFNLPLDINNNGFIDANGDLVSDLPVGFTLSSPPLQNPIFANTGFDTPKPQIVLIGADAILTGSGANMELGATPTRLFNVVVKVDASVPEGTVVPLNIFVPVDPFGPLFNIAGPNGPVVTLPVMNTPALGSITVIPEPAIITMSLLAIVVFRQRGRVRR